MQRCETEKAWQILPESQGKSWDCDPLDCRIHRTVKVVFIIWKTGAYCRFICYLRGLNTARRSPELNYYKVEKDIHVFVSASVSFIGKFLDWSSLEINHLIKWSATLHLCIAARTGELLDWTQSDTGGIQQPGSECVCLLMFCRERQEMP